MPDFQSAKSEFANSAHSDIDEVLPCAHPSKSDVEITAQLIRAASLFRLKCYDHIIVARDGITSFVALGIM